MFPSRMGSQACETTSSSISSSSSKEMGNLSLQTENYPRNLLQRFISSEAQASTRSGDYEQEEQVELNLGLSLGGRFGVDKHANRLKRSSSIAGSIPVFREIGDANTTPPSVPRPTLMRASSLPTETEEEWRKRKELQTLRRMEAKRRRCEKQRSSREENKALQVIAGARSSGEARSSGSSLSSQDQGNPEATGSLGAETGETGRTPRLLGETLHKTIENKGKEREHAMGDMPCVFTKGEGPNGKRVDGILYKYGKGEEVRIMCVCHGSFLSPAEFVKHAGGGDVDHPLRHIVINPSFASLS